jgi:23S rRNA U2552 (ribose-2'-O)-methylase RlmE/FtsJ
MYELIFTSCYKYPSISSYIPVSRAYFKHWEVLHDFEKEFTFLRTSSVKAAFLAEGPGGFIEAFVNKRKANGQDSIFGVTLISKNKTVPNWKLPRQFLETNNIKLLYGSDKTGSLYSKANIDSYILEIGKNECDYVTADGGFDFSNNYNNQENMSLKLIISEIYTSMSIQKLNGSFVLKVFDINLSTSKTLLNIIHQSYKTISFVKPSTSRTANSEKYLVCVDFLGISNENLQLLENAIIFNDTTILNKPINSVFCDHVSLYNIMFMTSQIININNALFMGQKVNMMKQQLEHAIKWCHKYNIPIRKTSILYYKHILQYNNLSSSM